MGTGSLANIVVCGVDVRLDVGASDQRTISLLLLAQVARGHGGVDCEDKFPQPIR
jgi:hypothetical protein